MSATIRKGLRMSDGGVRDASVTLHITFFHL
jgi:hypothetical protein